MIIEKYLEYEERSKDNRSDWVFTSKPAKKNQGFWHEKEQKEGEKQIDLKCKREITIKHE